MTVEATLPNGLKTSVLGSQYKTEDDENLNLLDGHLGSIANPHGVTAVQAGAEPALGFTPEDSANKAVANGYAGLDGSIKVPSAQLPTATEAVVGALEVATAAEVSARTDDTKIITPAKLPVAATGVSGIVTYVTQTIQGAKTFTANAVITGIVRIGSAGTADATLHVAPTVLPSFTPPAGVQFLIENNGFTNVMIAGLDNQPQWMTFASPSSTGAFGALINWQHSALLMKIATYVAGADISFSTALLAEAMRIKASGRVGIGIAAPANILDVYHASEKVNSKNGYLTDGADFGEYFESLDGQKIPFGVSVVIQKGKIRPARGTETPIGVISTTCSYVGNNGGSEWPDKYLRDDTGEALFEDFTETITKERPAMDEVDLYDEDGVVVGKHKVAKSIKKTKFDNIVKLVDGKYVRRRVEQTTSEPVMETYEETKTGNRPVINPAFDSAKGDYIRREDRDEWNVVGLLGQVRILKGQPLNPAWVKLKNISENVELWLVK